MTEAELIARMQASDTAPEVGTREARGAFDTGAAKFFNRVTGGRYDYLELLGKQARGEDTAGGVDQVRREAAKDVEANPLSATVGDIGGIAAEALPVTKALSGAGWLAKAPGIWGGVKRGAQIGTGVGVINEAAREADRLGSPTSATRDFLPIGNVFNVLKEGIAGGVGGGVGGLAGNYLTKGAGMIANRLPQPITDNVIAAALAAQKAAERVGLSGPGKLAPQEALRTIKDPALRAQGADAAAALEGLTAKAGRDFQTVGAPRGQGMLPAEQEAGRFRTDLRARTEGGVNQARVDAAKAATDEAAANATATAAAQAAAARAAEASAKGAKTPLNVDAEWGILGHPGLKALRDQIVADQRAAAEGMFRSGPTPRPSVSGAPYTAREAKKLAVVRHPKQTLGVLDEMIEKAADPATRTAARQARYAQDPVFKAADDAAQAATQTAARGGQMSALAQANAGGHAGRLASLDDILQSPGVGRVNAEVGQEASKTGGGLLGFNMAMLIRDIGRVAKDTAERGAVGQAGRRVYADPTEEILRRLGRQTMMQRAVQQTAYPVTHGLLAGSGFVPDY